MVDHPDQIEFLEEFISKNSTGSNIKWSVFIKVDTGYHRAGVTCDDSGISSASLIIDSKYLALKGLYSHW